MTDEVGVITGNLTLTTALRTDSRADIHVQYTGADESYTLTGSPVPVAPGGLHGLHVRVVEAVRRGGQAVVPGA
ncbi:hypothetical protein [Streptomyces sp. NPDC093109]|uniref:hypothetical protein n=1 Tax=Streptomyces sp. NPDC093109 TaxID=3154977 RepID=UPI00344D9AFF